MESLEILKQELITQKAEIEQKGGTVIVGSLNPSPSEITAGIKTITVPDLTAATATAQDVAEGKTFYSGNNTIKVGTQIIPNLTEATAAEDNVELGKTFYAGNNKLKTGTKIIPDLTLADAAEDNVEYGKTFFAGNNTMKTGNKIIPILTDATATEDDVLNGKTFYSGDNSIKTGKYEEIDVVLATATESDVTEGKTFFAGNKQIKTGTKIVPDLTIADAIEENVELGKTFYAGNNNLKTGTKIVPDLSIATATAQDVASGKTFYAGNNEIKVGTKEETSGGDNSDFYFKLFVTGDDIGTDTMYYTLPDGLKKLRSHIFYECENKYINFTFNTDIEEIDDYAFYKCANITFTNFDQLNNVKRFGGYSFGYLGNKINLEHLSPVINEISARAFQDSLQENTSIILPKGLSVYGNYAFSQEGKKEMQSLVMPDDIQLTSVGSYSFSNLMFDCDFKVPSTISALPSSFAYGCSFNNITIPATCKSFGNGAFYMLKTDSASYRRLKTVTFEAETPPTFGTYPFAEQDVTNNFKIYVPDNAVDTYKAVARLASFVNCIYPVSQKE